jgi:outer membrane immunogenic protein
MLTKSFLLIAAGAGAVSLAGAAAAQPASSWDGPYVGVLAGAQFGDAGFALPGDTGDVLQSDHASKTVFTWGGMVGFNVTTGGVLLGLEGDLMDANSKKTVVACTTPDGCFTTTHDSFTTFNNLKQTLNGRVRARVGIARGDNLFYVAGGYSIAKTRLNLVGDCFNPGDPTVPLVFTFSRARTLSGFNIGAGVEHAIGRHLRIRAEYIYDGYGNQTYAGDGTGEWNDRLISVHDSNLLLGVSYRF